MRQVTTGVRRARLGTQWNRTQDADGSIPFIFTARSTASVP